MELSLSKAAEVAGKSKSTINRAIKSGKLSANRNEDGSYGIDPAELSRVFHRTPKEPPQGNPIEPQGNPSSALQVRVEMLEAQLDREKETVEDLRKRLDKAEDRAFALTHQTTTQPPQHSLWERLWGR